MLEFCSAYGYIAAGLIGLAGGALGAFGRYLALARLVTSLEYAVADLESRVIREVKMRAGQLGVKTRKEDDELLERLKTVQPPNNTEPWWMTHVHPDLKK
jgi:hypothetical protein